jgi:ribosomal protein S18 acetylase RimI-like enzyme
LAAGLNAMKLKIQPMVIGDYSDIMSLWRNMEGVGLSEGDEKSGIRLYLRRNPGLCFVARDAAGNLFGAVLCGHDGRRGFLYHLAVAGNMRHQGIGRQLVDKCMAALRSEGIRKCTILVYADNEKGKQFWRKLGWNERADLEPMQTAIPARRAKRRSG